MNSSLTFKGECWTKVCYNWFFIVYIQYINIFFASYFVIQSKFGKRSFNKWLLVRVKKKVMEKRKFALDPANTVDEDEERYAFVFCSYKK